MTTKLQFSIKFVCALVLISVITACGAKSHQVASKPPVFDFSQKPYSVEYGTVAVQSIAIFYWPDESEAQLEVAARTIKTSADVLDGVARKKIEFANLAGGFVKLECVQNFALATQDQPGSPVPWIVAWKVLPDLVVVNPVPEGDSNYENYQNYLKLQAAHKLFEYCQDNQAKRMPLFQWLATTGARQEQEANLAIAKSVDPTFPNQVNMQSATAAGTTIKIASTPEGPKVDVTIQDFLVKGYSPSTEAQLTPNGPTRPAIFGAMFLSDRRLLVFGIAEIGADRKPTGRHFEIKLERGPDFVGMARFSGAIDLMDGKTILRTGSMSITGVLIPESN